MAMSKKDFIALADAIKSHNGDFGESHSAFHYVHIETLADFCQTQNPNFNRERWLSYIAGEVGPSGGKVTK